MIRTLATIAAAGGLILAVSCDTARDEYSYKTSEPLPTLPPPKLDSAPGITSVESTNSGAPAPTQAVPPTQPFDFAAVAPKDPTKLAEVVAAGLHFRVPPDWKGTPSPSRPRVGQFAVPGPSEGAPGAELVIINFGAGQGGSPEDNITRWLGQFAPGGPEAMPAEVKRGTVAGLRLVAVTTEGTFTPASGPGLPPPVPQKGFGLFGLIAEGGPEGPVFFRLTGPAEAVRAATPGMFALAATLKAEGSTTAVPEPTMPGAPDAAPTPPASGAVVAGLNLPFPESWRRETPSGSMRAAQYTIVGEGDASAEVVVFHFGPGQGGSKQDNISRWLRQVRPADGKPASESARIAESRNGALVITTVVADGTYSGMSMSGASAPAIADARLFGIIVEGGPEGSVFIRITGPASLLDREGDAIDRFARGIALR